MRVLVLNIDGLQPAYLGPYGCEWVPTPTLDRFAAAGIVYDWHFADCPDPAVVPAWRTGRHPLLDGPTGDLLGDLKVAGVRTARIGPKGGADGRETTVATKRDADPLALKPVRRAMRQVLEELGDTADALVWVDIDALLPPWAPSDESVSELFAVDEEEEPIEPWSGSLPERIARDGDASFDRLQRTYAAAVATLDGSLDKFLVDCAKRGWGDDAVIVLTAGRGFPLGEHGAVGFGEAGLHEELIHLPLMVRRPNGDQAGMRIGTLTQPADLGAMLRTQFGLPTPHESTRSHLVVGVGEQWGYRTAEWYLIMDGGRRLFVKPDDRWEVNDVEARNQEFADELEKQFLW